MRAACVGTASRRICASSASFVGVATRAAMASTPTECLPVAAAAWIERTLSSRIAAVANRWASERV